MEIQSITLDVLREMQNVLSESAGYTVSIEDEIEYFGPNAAKSWYLIRGADGQILGFIRNFTQNSEWSLAELYIQPNIDNRRQITSSLLNVFKSTTSFPVGHRLRFDISSHDLEVNETLREEGFSEKCQTFLYFERSLNDRSYPLESDLVSLADAKSVAEVLNHLHPVSVDEAQKWIESKTIRGVKCDGEFVAAAQIYESDEALEVNRFATHELFLRRGFAKKLMEQIFVEAAALQKRRVYLKVEDTRLPAISFYKSLGFTESQDKRQTWHSRFY
ncbi:GNAT family N-acetyltransferase [Bdellovibrio sp. HCB2-146]|uniref:GNAT family N-acetyltransferase n=1 Tax=Bdellovibrio sp. HCB2-146 TaxID=3394362 RepID=UPI0039BC2F5E